MESDDGIKWIVTYRFYHIKFTRKIKSILTFNRSQKKKKEELTRKNICIYSIPPLHKLDQHRAQTLISVWKYPCSTKKDDIPFVSFPYQFVNGIQNVARHECIAKSINNIPSRIFRARFDLHLHKGETRLNLSRLRGNEREGRNALFVNHAVSSFRRNRKLNHRRTKEFKIM